MDTAVVNCFAESAVEVLTSELGAQVSVGEPALRGAEYVAHGITGLIGVTGHLKGLVIFGLSEDTALALVSRMVGHPFTAVDGMVKSGIAELGNVVVGSAVTSLAGQGYQCGITPPAVLVGERAELSMPSLNRLVLPILTPSGTIEMQLMLRENGRR